jgi:hypothetical protein
MRLVTRRHTGTLRRVARSGRSGRNARRGGHGC